MKKKLILITLYTLISGNLTHAIWIGCDWNASADTPLATEQSIQNQKEQKQLQEQLNELESAIFKTKHLSLMNPIREKTAFLIAVAGLCGSLVTPFKMVKSRPNHPIKTFGNRAAVMVATFFATTTIACIVSFFRPFLWYSEFKRDKLKKKIFDLKNTKYADKH